MLKKDQITTKKRLAETVTEQQLALQMDAFRSHIHDILSRFKNDILEMKTMLGVQKFDFQSELMQAVKEEAVQKDGAVPKELHLKADFIRILDGKI